MIVSTLVSVPFFILQECMVAKEIEPVLQTVLFFGERMKSGAEARPGEGG